MQIMIMKAKMSILCYLILFAASLFDHIAANKNLKGKSGSLRVTTDDDDETNYNTQKLVIFFDSDCASTEDEISVMLVVFLAFLSVAC